MKFLITLCLLCSLATVAWTSSASWGRRNSNDLLLLRENVIQYPLKNNYRNINVNFPKSGQGNTRNITAIFVYDRFTNSSGAQPSLWSGGPGYKFANINLKSQYNSGINSSVEIYGR